MKTKAKKKRKIVKCSCLMIAEGSAGREYGHVPGHSYHDVTVCIEKKGAQYRAVALEVWGSAQECDEEEGRRKVVARGSDPRAVLAQCAARAHAAGINTAGWNLSGPWLPLALSECENALEDALAKPASRKTPSRRPKQSV